LVAKDLHRSFNEFKAVNGVSFEIKKGEIFGLLGPNGAGKTTTIRMLSTVLEADSGEITIGGYSVKKDAETVRSLIGVCPQDLALYEDLSAMDNMVFFGRMAGMNGKDARVQASDHLTLMGLQDRAKGKVAKFSGGMKRRVNLAIALMGNPRLVFLDEPTTGLDPKSRREVWEVIAGLKKKGKTIFLTTHYMEEAEYLADHIAIIHKGKIIAEGSLEELINKHGSGSTLHIRNCKTRGAIKILKEKGFDAKSEGNSDIAVKIDFKERTMEVLSNLRHECVEYDSIDIRRSNLEEVFLHLTGSKLSEGNT